MKQWWLSRNARDRQAIIIGVTACFFLLMYVFIWSPFANQTERIKKRVTQQSNTLNWMKLRTEEVLELKSKQAGKTPSAKNEALLTLVDRTAKQNKLRTYIQRLKPEGSDNVQLWIEQVPFDTLIRWLGTLVRQNNILIDSATIERQESPGLVNARLNLQRESGSE